MSSKAASDTSTSGKWEHSAFLALNAGSSSLKVSLYSASGEEALVTGLVDRIGPQATLRLKTAKGKALQAPPGSDLSDHAGALEAMISAITKEFPKLKIVAIGHRVVHGGQHLTGPTVVTPETLAAIEALKPLAPLHQPHNVLGIHLAQEAFPGVLQVACFDTSFHRHQPFVSDTFALPERYYEEGVRRYGFHGLSYDYIAGEVKRLAPRLYSGRVAVAHLGNGASMCAILNGRSVASSMGFSVLDGLPMGTRCGQIDPGVLLYMLEKEKLDKDQLNQVLYYESGLLGLSGGLSNDMRTLEESDSPKARRAIDYFTFRVQRELGSMAAAMAGLDLLVFCGGIGENSSTVRRLVCDRLDWIGIELDDSRNVRGETVISSEFSRTTVMVIPTREDMVIVRALRAAAGVPPEAEPVNIAKE